MLRKITEKDLMFARRLRNKNRKYFFNDKVITALQHQLWYLIILKENDYHFYIVWEKNKRVGTISVKVGEVIEIGNVLIDDQYRNNGYCRKAIRDLLELYPNKEAFVEIFPNEKITSIYKAIGFKEKRRKLWI